MCIRDSACGIIFRGAPGDDFAFEVLPNGQLVIEASRDVEVTDQRQTMVLRGIVRPQDVSPANVVSSTAISHMEVNLTGKGVITEGTHPPSGIVRLLLRVVGF